MHFLPKRSIIVQHTAVKQKFTDEEMNVNARARRGGYRPRPINGLTGNQLKLIGVMAMLADHIGAVIIQSGILHARDPLMYSMIIATPEGHRWMLIGRVCRFAGRLAFPIFAYLLVEGFAHTRSRLRYALSLGILALAAEVPFNLAIFDSLLHPAYQNVVFTLLIGLLVLCAVDYFDNLPLQLLLIAAGCGLSWVIKSDYNVLGVLLIAGLYMFRRNDTAQLACGITLSAMESVGYFCISALSYVPIVLYNGRRGAFGFKYVFYVFYPLHFLALYALAKWFSAYGAQLLR